MDRSLSHNAAAPTRLDLDLSAPPPIPESGIARAVEVVRSGWLHRYGESLGDASDASLLEDEFARSIGVRYAVAVNSCGSAMFLALKCCGVGPGTKVLMNAFTLAPVPGAIVHAGAEPVLVEITPDLVIDLNDLERQAETSGARYLLLSHMRGHIADMTRLMALCERLRLTVIEDCAHTMGAGWAGRPTGTFGKVGCFSLQAYKHVNAGEGGILATDDADVAARAILFSGSYMLYGQHRNRPPEDVFARWRDVTPNFSMRMGNMAAALARSQLAALPERKRIWNDRHGRLAAKLADVGGLRLPHRPQAEEYVQSSIQFSVSDLDDAAFQAFLSACAARGVFLKWFGHREPRGYTSVPDHWRYLADARTPPNTAGVVERLCDMRIPLSLSPEQCDLIAAIVAEELARMRGSRATSAT
jgi:dTDP-4-amino-4,6-dideoxygalactose transaminase